MRKLSFVVFALIALSACHRDHGLSKCDSMICTPGFAQIVTQVTYAGPTKAQLDEVYTVNTETGERLDINQNLGAGFFVILDDNYRARMAGQTLNFHLVGKRDQAIVLEESYTISADCCHVKKESGKDMVILR